LCQEGNIYYVLTAKHLVRGKIDLKVVTDGQEYPVNNSTVKPGRVSLALCSSLATKHQVATLANYSTEDRVVLSLGGLSQDKLPENQAISLPLISFGLGLSRRWTPVLFFRL